MIIISGSSNPQLAENIALSLGQTCIKAMINRFEDQELRIQIDGQLYEQDIVIIGSTSNPANDHLMELLLLVDTVRRAGAKRITAVIPYFGYSRQDRSSKLHEPISASLVATLLEAAGVNRVITLDLHSKQIEGFFKIGVQNLEMAGLFMPLFKDKEYLVVSPDIGGLTRAKKFSQELGSSLAIINKTRTAPGECEMREIIGEVRNKHCLIVDDIIDTAGTICKAAELLIQQGALSVNACVTHAVFSKQAINKVEKSAIDKLYVSNSIIQLNLPSKIKVIVIEELLAKSLRVI